MTFEFYDFTIYDFSREDYDSVSFFQFNVPQLGSLITKVALPKIVCGLRRTCPTAKGVF